jgi:hypothetical protein
MMAAWWIGRRVIEPGLWETFFASFGLATLTRYVLRKEFLLDIRGLRKTLPREIETKTDR